MSEKFYIKRFGYTFEFYVMQKTNMTILEVYKKFGMRRIERLKEFYIDKCIDMGIECDYSSPYEDMLEERKTSFFHKITSKIGLA